MMCLHFAFVLATKRIQGSKKGACKKGRSWEKSKRRGYCVSLFFNSIFLFF